MLALLFPGQGSQEVGMGRDVYEASAAARAVFDAADESLGFEISKLCFEGPEDDLRRTEIQQPAILTTSIAYLRALEEQGAVESAYVAGHSLGEYSALVAAGAIPFEDAVRLVNARGRFMQEAVPEGRGSMAAVLGGDVDDIVRICQRVSEETGLVVTPANFNSPQQTVIAGDAAAVETACTRLKAAGAKRTVPLDVSAPFHCSLMARAADKLEPEIARVRFSDARVPVVTNVEAAPNADAARIPDLLKQQVTAPVRFTDMAETLAGLGVTHYLEIGPGRVLFGLMARINRRSNRASLGSMAEFEEAQAFLAEAAA